MAFYEKSYTINADPCDWQIYLPSSEFVVADFEYKNRRWYKNGKLLTGQFTYTDLSTNRKNKWTYVWRVENGLPIEYTSFCNGMINLKYSFDPPGICKSETHYNHAETETDIKRELPTSNTQIK